MRQTEQLSRHLLASCLLAVGPRPGAEHKRRRNAAATTTNCRCTLANRDQEMGRDCAQKGDEDVGAHELQPQQPVGGAIGGHEVGVDDCAAEDRQVRCAHQYMRGCLHAAQGTDNSLAHGLLSLPGLSRRAGAQQGHDVVRSAHLRG